MEWNYEGYIDSYGIPVFETPKDLIKGPQGVPITLGVVDYWQNEVDADRVIALMNKINNLR